MMLKKARPAGGSGLERGVAIKKKITTWVSWQLGIRLSVCFRCGFLTKTFTAVQIVL